MTSTLAVALAIIMIVIAAAVIFYSRSQINEVTTRSGQLHVDGKEKEKTIQALDNKIAELQLQIEQVDSKGILKGDCSSISQELAAVKAEFDSYRDERSDIEDELAKKTVQLDRVTEKLTEAEIEDQKKGNILQSLQLEYNAMLRKNQEHRLALSKLEAEVQRSNTRIIDLEGLLSKCNSDLKGEEQKIADIRQDCEANMKRSKELASEELRRMEERMNDEASKAKELRGLLRICEDERDKALARATTAETNLGTKSSNLGAEITRREKAENDLAAKETELQRLRLSLTEDQGKSAECSGKLATAVSEIESLKSEISNLKEVQKINNETNDQVFKEIVKVLKDIEGVVNEAEQLKSSADGEEKEKLIAIITDIIGKLDEVSGLLTAGKKQLKDFDNLNKELDERISELLLEKAQCEVDLQTCKNTKRRELRDKEDEIERLQKELKKVEGFDKENQQRIADLLREKGECELEVLACKRDRTSRIRDKEDEIARLEQDKQEAAEKSVRLLADAFEIEKNDLLVKIRLLEVDLDHCTTEGRRIIREKDDRISQLNLQITAFEDERIDLVATMAMMLQEEKQEDVEKAISLITEAMTERKQEAAEKAVRLVAEQMKKEKSSLELRITNLEDQIDKLNLQITAFEDERIDLVATMAMMLQEEKQEDVEKAISLITEALTERKQEAAENAVRLVAKHMENEKRILSKTNDKLIGEVSKWRDLFERFVSTLSAEIDDPDGHTALLEALSKIPEGDGKYQKVKEIYGLILKLLNEQKDDLVNKKEKIAEEWQRWEGVLLNFMKSIPKEIASDRVNRIIRDVIEGLGPETLAAVRNGLQLINQGMESKISELTASKHVAEAWSNEWLKEMQKFIPEFLTTIRHDFFKNHVNETLKDIVQKLEDGDFIAISAFFRNIKIIIDSNNAEIKETLGACEARLKGFDRSENPLQEQLQTCIDNKREIESTFNSTKSALDSCLIDKEGLQGDLKKARENIGTITEAKGKIETELQSTKAERDTFKDQLTTCSSGKAAIEKDLTGARADRDSFEALWKTCSGEKAGLQQELKTTKTERDSFKDQLTGLQETVRREFQERKGEKAKLIRESKIAAIQDAVNVGCVAIMANSSSPRFLNLGLRKIVEKNEENYFSINVYGYLVDFASQSLAYWETSKIRLENSELKVKDSRGRTQGKIVWDSKSGNVSFTTGTLYRSWRKVDILIPPPPDT